MDVADAARCNVMVQFVDGTDWEAHVASLGKFLMVAPDDFSKVRLVASSVVSYTHHTIIYKVHPAQRIASEEDPMYYVLEDPEYIDLEALRTMSSSICRIHRTPAHFQKRCLHIRMISFEISFLFNFYQLRHALDHCGGKLNPPEINAMPLHINTPSIVHIQTSFPSLFIITYLSLPVRGTWVAGSTKFSVGGIQNELDIVSTQ
jgi:hypothetical protein